MDIFLGIPLSVQVEYWVPWTQCHKVRKLAYKLQNLSESSESLKTDIIEASSVKDYLKIKYSNSKLKLWQDRLHMFNIEKETSSTFIIQKDSTNTSMFSNTISPMSTSSFPTVLTSRIYPWKLSNSFIRGSATGLGRRATMCIETRGWSTNWYSQETNW